MAKGDHIKVGRGAYTHHGIDCGDGTVIHFTGEPGRKANAAVSRTSIREFKDGAREVEVVSDGSSRSPDEIVRAAERKVGEIGYDLMVNNCEHFASECRTGKKESRQADDEAPFEIKKALALGMICGTAALVKKTGEKATLGQHVGMGALGLVATGLGLLGAAAVSKVRRDAEKRKETAQEVTALFEKFYPDDVS